MYAKVLRGIGKIGGNIIEIGTESTKIILDCGKDLPEIGEYYVKDDIKVDGLNQGISTFNAVFLTHYHGDHVGLIDTVNADIPIYGSRETKEYIAFLSKCFDGQELKVNEIEPNQVIKIGDMEITPISANHSAKGAMMYLIQGDGKTILYTGDFSSSIIQPPLEIDIMLCEGTNIGFESSKILDEDTVAQKIYDEIKDENKPVFIIGSSANVDRVQSVLDACEKCGKTLIVELFTYSLLRALHTEEEWKSRGFDKILFYSNPHTDNIKYPLLKENFHKYIDFAKSIYNESIDATKLVAFSIKSNIKGMVHKCFANRNLDKDGVKIIYSIWTGYKNEKRLGQDLAFLENHYNAQILDIHASGHITKEKLIQFVNEVKPKIIIPIHTENAKVFGEEFKNVVNLTNDERYDYGD